MLQRDGKRERWSPTLEMRTPVRPSARTVIAWAIAVWRTNPNQGWFEVGEKLTGWLKRPLGAGRSNEAVAAILLPATFRCVLADRNLFAVTDRRQPVLAYS